MRYLLAIFLCLFICEEAYSQRGIITTIAGNGVARDGGDGGIATNASLNGRGVVAIDSTGTYYLTGTGLLYIRKVSLDGIIDTFAGTGLFGFAGDGGTAINARFKDPNFVTQDKYGNSYISDGTNYRIRKVDYATSIINTIAGNGGRYTTADGFPATSTGIGATSGIGFDTSGNIFFCGPLYLKKVDATTNIVTTIAGTGITSTVSGDGGPATNATGGFIWVLVDNKNIIYTSDNFRVIRKIDPITGIISRVAGIDDTVTTYADGIPATDAHIHPSNLAKDDLGNIYFCDAIHHRIRKIDTNGYIYTIAGTGIAGFSGDGGMADTAKLNNPQTIVLDQCGNILFSDGYNNRIRKITYPYYPSVRIDNEHLDTTEGGVIHLCSSIPITVTSISTRQGRNPVYKWSINGVVTRSSSPILTYTPHNGDSINVTLVSSIYCVTDSIAVSNTIRIIIDSLPPATVTVNGPPSALIGDTVHVTATIIGARSAYLLKWYNNDTLFATTTLPETNYIKRLTIDSISAILTSISRGCYDSCGSPIKTVLLHTASVGFVANTFEISLQPNPGEDEVQISTTEKWEHISAKDITGRVIISETNTGLNTLTVDISKWSQGVYFFDVDGVVMRFIKM